MFGPAAVAALMSSAGRKFVMTAATGGMAGAEMARDMMTSMKGVTAGMSH